MSIKLQSSFSLFHVYCLIKYKTQVSIEPYICKIKSVWHIVVDYVIVVFISHWNEINETVFTLESVKKCRNSLKKCSFHWIIPNCSCYVIYIFDCIRSISRAKSSPVHGGITINWGSPVNCNRSSISGPTSGGMGGGSKESQDWRY